MASALPPTPGFEEGWLDGFHKGLAILHIYIFIKRMQADDIGLVEDFLMNI